MMNIRGTTILAVKHRGKVTVAGDGQVTFDTTVMKHGARKVRRLYHNQVIVGFAGTTADAFTLFDRFDQKLEQFKGNLLRAAVELTKDWRTDRVLRHLEALMIAVSRDSFLIISGNGDVIESDDNVMAIGSGGPYALAAARAMVRYSDLTANEIARESVKIASEICIFTNDQIVKLINSEVAEKNKKFGSWEQIKKITIVPEFTVENKMMTPTLKVKKNVAMEAFKDKIISMHPKE